MFLKCQRPSVSLQMTTATRAPSLTRPRLNRKTVAAPAPPRTPPPPPTAKEATPRPSRAPTAREVSRARSAASDISWYCSSAHKMDAEAASCLWPYRLVPPPLRKTGERERTPRRLRPERVFVSSGKSTPSSETSERAQSAKRDALSLGEKNSSDSKATQVRTHAAPPPLTEVKRRRAMMLIGSRFSL